MMMTRWKEENERKKTRNEERACKYKVDMMIIWDSSCAKEDKCCEEKRYSSVYKTWSKML